MLKIDLTKDNRKYISVPVALPDGSEEVLKFYEPNTEQDQALSALALELDNTKPETITKLSSLRLENWRARLKGNTEAIEAIFTAYQTKGNIYNLFQKLEAELGKQNESD